MRPIIVSGLGRCGTSLVMQMLEVAGGVRCLGEYPFIDDNVDALRLGWPKAEDPRFQHAVKALGPKAAELCPQDSIFIWCMRNEYEQSRSYQELIDSAFPESNLSRHEIRQELYRQETEMDTVLSRRGIKPFYFRVFEHVNPEQTAALLDIVCDLRLSEETRDKMASVFHVKHPPMTPDQIASYREALLTEVERRNHAA